MTEKEKQAIDILKTFEFRRRTKNYNKLSLEDSQSVDILLNYIDKLQKDNYKLDRENQHFFDRIQDLQKEIKSKNKQIKLMQEMNLSEEIEINYISKDIIRNKIKELEDIKNKNIEHCSIDYFRLSRAINILKELLGGE